MQDYSQTHTHTQVCVRASGTSLHCLVFWIIIVGVMYTQIFLIHHLPSISV